MSKEETMLERVAIGGVSQFAEGSGITFVIDVDGFYLDIGVYPDLTVSAYLKKPDGSEQVIHEGTPIEDVDPAVFQSARAMLSKAKERAGE